MNKLVTESIDIFHRYKDREEKNNRHRIELLIEKFFGGISDDTLRYIEKSGHYSIVGTSWELVYSSFFEGFMIIHQYEGGTKEYYPSPIYSKKDLGQALSWLIKKFGI